ncbi:twin-arginine translocation signal domain-containing protein [Haloferax profundi]|uniref:Right handed beta helix domain-containing protein n=1 Tax=Haloferax profundi TaxID=1544718 RepID=A0A0W1SKD2_9EURY|nr:twin-arginine translocation signal domain-containing protein [Haloferax profundi]KTG26721.1 hypothetical protein AUR66_15790 [Haloferax profundi]
MQRRDYLKYGGAVGLAAGLAGCLNRLPFFEGPPEDDDRTTDEYTPPELESSPLDRYGNVVDIVEAGGDPSGEEVINDVLQRVVEDDTAVVFPDGRYKLDQYELESVSNFAFVAADGATPKLVPNRPAHELDDNLFIRLEGISDFLLEGVELDYTADGFGGSIHIIADGNFTLRDVRLRGKMPDEERPNNPAAFRLEVLDRQSSALVERLIARDGGHEGGNAVGTYVGSAHAGSMTFRDCVIENFPNNGLYASSPGRPEESINGADGVVHVEGGLYKNNNIANVRIGTTGSTVRGVTIVVNEVPPSPPGALNARGLRLRGKSGQLVEDCLIYIGKEAGEGFGALVFHSDTGRATIRNTTIRVDRDDTYAIHALDPDSSAGPLGSTFENVRIVGTAGFGHAVSINGRDGTTFKGCEVNQTGRDRNGFRFANSNGCKLTDSVIKVTGEAVETVNSSLSTVNLTVELP